MRLNGFRWGPKVSRSQMVIHSPQPANGSPNSRWAPRTGSLYEDIPLFGMFDICVYCRLSSHFYKIVDFLCLLLLVILMLVFVFFVFMAQFTQTGFYLFSGF
jgi:hypothetical protein